MLPRLTTQHPALLYVQVFVLAWCPESPVWLEGIGRQDAADTACLKLWGVYALVPDPGYPEVEETHHSSHFGAASAAAAAAAGPQQQQQQQQQPLLLLAGSTGTSSKGSSMVGLSAAAAAAAAAAASSPVRRMQQQPFLPAAAAAAWDSPRYSSAAAGAAGSGGWDGGSSFVGMTGLQSASSDLGWGDLGLGSPLGEGQGLGRRVAGGGWDSLLDRQYRWMMLLALGLPLLQQASGINTVVYYSSQVREEW
jgi:hypothetical protein